MSRELLRQVLEALENAVSDDQPYLMACNWSITALRAALEQPAPVREPSHDVVAGAIFDFAGFLTTLPGTVSFGSSHNAAPMVDLIREWAASREVNLESDSVMAWQEAINGVTEC